MKSVSRRVELLGVVAAGAVRAFLQLLLELADTRSETLSEEYLTRFAGLSPPPPLFAEDWGARCSSPELQEAAPAGSRGSSSHIRIALVARNPISWSCSTGFSPSHEERPPSHGPTGRSG